MQIGRKTVVVGCLGSAALLLASGLVGASEVSLGQLNNTHHPERQSGSAEFQRSMEQPSRNLVQMQQESFYLDPGFIPLISGPSGYMLVQLNDALSHKQRIELQAVGVALLEYIPDHTWVARLDGDAIDAVHALSFVHALGHVYPSDKLPARLLTHDLSPRSQHNGQLTLEVSFFADQTVEQAISQLRSIDANTAQKAFFSGQRLTVTLPPEKLLELAKLNTVRWIEEPAAPIGQDNTDSAALIGVTPLQQGISGLNGEGVTIAGWEGAPPQQNHPDFSGRVTIAQGNGSSDHATHVTGTLIGNGQNSVSATGMAPKANYVAYDFHGDIPGEMRTARSSYHASLSNHSWGYITGWSDNYYQSGIWTWFGHPSENKDSDFGRYSNATQQWDTFVAASDAIVVKSAGNNRNDYGAAAGEGHHHLGNANTLHFDSHGPDGDYNSIDMIAAAKNIITVGAVNDIGRISSFSGWGPTDDGRIKPDVVANGISVYSTFPNSRYGIMSGSSMATPAVSGALALVSELYRNIYGNAPGAATIKALIVHSAQDKGNPGPDYSYGWGVLDASAAADILKTDNGSGRFLRQSQLGNGSLFTYPIIVSESSDELIATIAWTDIAASPYSAIALVNDLDLELVDPDGVIYYPFTLSGLSNPSAPARQDRPNRLDNIEQVRVKQPTAGEWQIRVRGQRVQYLQAFTLVSTTGLTSINKAVGADAATRASGGSGGGSPGLGLLLLMTTLFCKYSGRPA